MADIIALGTIFGWAFLSFWSAIPAGIALPVSPISVALTVTISYGCGAALVARAGAPLRARIARRLKPTSPDNPPANRAARAILRAWQRYGLIGLALLAPITVGAQLGAVIGLSLGAKPLRLVVAMTLGAALWSAGITLAVVAGLLAVTG
jgi:F0F1-type ATP synthase assembly protein I